MRRQDRPMMFDRNMGDARQVAFLKRAILGQAVVVQASRLHS